MHFRSLNITSYPVQYNIVIHQSRTPEFECGYPGRPANGSLTSRAQAYYPLERARYHCHDGFVLFGVAERTCQANGSWTGQVPVCDFNLARGKITQQSKTLWNYHADLAADGKPETCSYTPREPEHRWWQVNLGRQYDIAAVAVTISPGE
ncbi:unnamed protein product [Cyprideis torosa]|uniref:Uncharacterized protein n=1 Tax=Cyprideis torosa TaxID=163714 RepID=A0A7R8ZKN9_9CRUS|nr:unnamed protein product [Cyprideis torosa]CAG0880630.1 unnamed protein product [Cyprideis torosa]